GHAPDHAAVAPGGSIGEQRLEQATIERMAGPHAAEMADHRRTREIQVAERVEHLVAHELVDIAQPLAIEHAIAVDDHGIVERAAAREAGGAHLTDPMKEAEGGRAAQIAFKACGVDRDGEVLPADGAAGE